MRCKALLRHAVLWTLGVFIGLSPMNIAQMAVSLLAVNNGFFDDVPVEKVLACEHDMHQYVAQQLPDVMERILKTGELSAEDEQRLKDAIAAFKKSWV